MSLPPALVAKFTAHLAVLHDEVVGLRAALAAPGGAEGDQQERLRTIAHQLAGTSEPYGFADLGACAQRLQNSLSGLTADAPRVAEDIGRFADALSAAARCGSS